MKYKTSAKALRESAQNLRSAGYCDLQFLLQFHKPRAYTCGIYGWNFDVFQVYGLTICTGYRGMPGKRLEGIREANEKAFAILSGSGSYEEKRDQVEQVLRDFCISNGGGDPFYFD